MTESRPDSTTEILRHVLRTVLPLVRADLGGVFIFDESFARVVTGAIEGVQPPGSLPPVAVAGVPPATVPVERWLRSNRRPLHLFRPSDWRRFPPVNPGLRALAAAGHLVGLAVPLLWDGTLVGAAYFWRHREPVPFARREIQEVVRWCRLVSSVAISTRLLTSEAALRADLEQLLALSRTLEEATSFSALGHAVYAALAQILAPASLLLVLRTEPEPLILASAEIPATLGTRLAPALAHWEALSRSDREFYWLSREQARRELGDWIEELPGAVRELLFAPLDGPIPGCVLAWNDDALSQLRERKESVLSILLGQTSAAAARLANQLALERTIDQLRALLSVAESVAATDSIAGLLERVEQALRTRLRYDALIFLKPDTPAMLRVTWSSGAWPEATVGNTIPLEQSLAGYVYRTGRALAVPDTWSDPRTYHRPDRRFPLRSLVLYPIQTQERTVAILGFGRTALDPFSETDQHLGNLVAHELSQALVVVTQREALRTHARNQALLTDLSQLLLRESDPRRFAQPSVERLAAWSGSDVALVLRCPLDRGTVVAAAGAHRTSLERQLLMLADPACIRWLAAAAANGPLVFPTSDTAPEAFRQPIADLIRGLGPLLVLPLTPAGLPSGLLVCSVPPQLPAQRQTMLDTLRRAGERLREALESWISDSEREFATRLAYELAAAGDEQAFAARLLDVVTPLFVCDFGAVLRADNERHLWYPLAVTARGQEHSPRWHLGFDELASLGAAAECQVSIVSVTGPSPLDPLLPPRAADRPISLLVAPVCIQGSLAAVVLLGRDGTDAFNHADQRRLSELAARATFALQLLQARERERALYRASVQALAAAIDARDRATHDHSRRVAFIARLIAEQMQLPREEIEEIELAALLHDIGKLGVPDAILRKPGKLTPSEWALVRTHPDVGAEILAGFPQLQRIVPLVRAHHERWDGTGYPSGLRGDAIPLGAAIIGLADTLDTMLSDRPYRPALPLSEAVEEIRRCRATQLHPDVVDAFLAALQNPNGLPLVLS